MMEWPDDIIRLVWSFTNARNHLEEAMRWQHTQRIVSIHAQTQVEDTALVQNAEQLYLECQEVRSIQLYCNRLELQWSSLDNVRLPRLKSLSMNGSHITNCRPLVLESMDIVRCSFSQWPFVVKSLNLQESRIHCAMTVDSLHLGLGYSLDNLAQWTFRKLAIEEDPLHFLDACITHGLTLKNTHFDVSNLRMFEPNGTFFRKMM